MCLGTVGRPKKYFASSNPHPPHSQAYDREHGCVNSSMVFEWLGAYDCSTSFALRALSSTCLRADLENSNIGSVNKAKPLPTRNPTGDYTKLLIHNPKQHKSITLSEPQGTLKRVHSKHEGTNMKCKPNCAPGGTLSKTRLASCSCGILAGSTGEYRRAWPDTRQDPAARDTQRDTQRDPLASYSAILRGNTHWRAVGGIHSAGSTGELLWIHSGYSAGYSAGFTGGRLCWGSVRRLVSEEAFQDMDYLLPTVSKDFAGLIPETFHTGKGSEMAQGCYSPSGSYPLGSTGQLLWRDTWRDPLAGRSGETLGGMHWRAALAGYSAGSTGEPVWRDTRQDPVASSSGGILGGIHWRAARDNVGE